MTVESQVTPLGVVRLLGKRDATIWELSAYAPRLPKGGKTASGTPGSHALRVLQSRPTPRYLHYAKETSWRFVRFIDPVLLDLFLASGDKDGKALELTVLGVVAKVFLAGGCRVLASPLWEHPGQQIGTENNERENNVVPAYRLEGARIALDVARSAQLSALLPGLLKDHSVELTPAGIVYTAAVYLNGVDPLPTRVRLERNGNKVRLVSLDEQPARDRDAWMRQWRTLDEIVAASCRTAWLRLGFQRDGQLPVLRWSETQVNKKITVDWGTFELPEGVAQLSLADQPLESRVLAPVQVLRLSRPMHLALRGSTLRVRVASNGVLGQDKAGYRWDGAEETLDFGTLALVHAPQAVRARLDALQGRETAADASAMGFVRLSDGWAQVPFDELPGLPAAVTPGDVQDARGSFWLGNRRAEFLRLDARPKVAPWSVQMDEPADYSVDLSFSLAGPKDGKPALERAEVVLDGFALSMRGMLWLSADRPDGHDGLPRVSDDPDAFFDVPLRRCSATAMQVPITLGPLVLKAPVQPLAGWNTATDRQALEPEWKGDPTLTLTQAFATAAHARKRIWLRHPTLPSVQLMAVTRADPLSTHPHASRALLPFDSDAALQLQGLQGMAPQLTATTRATLAPAEHALDGSDFPAPSLAALSLPGVELRALPGQTYQATGRYTLPLWDELNARATLPPPEHGRQIPPAIVTALDDAALARHLRDNQRLLDAASTVQSLMFAALPANGQGPLENLYPGYASAASVGYDDQVRLLEGHLTLGSIAFKDGDWRATLSGDALLQGPQASLAIDAGTCSIGMQGSLPLVGWSVPERRVDSSIHDGSGLLWGDEVVGNHSLLIRQVGVQKHDLRLLTSRQPLSVSGPGGVRWWLAFSDLPVIADRMPGEGEGDAVRLLGQYWSWSLFDRETDPPLQIVPLALGPCLRFLPTALVALTLAQDSIATVSIEGSLVLGRDNPVLVGDSLRRMRITLSAAEGGGLAISAIDTANGQGDRITWDLDLEPREGLYSGAPQLSGRLVLDAGVLWLDDARLRVRVLGSDCVVDYPSPGRLDLRQPLARIEPAITADLSRVQVAGLTLDLVRARLTWLQLRADLRESVFCLLETGFGSATLNWFGNVLTLEARLDPQRGVCIMTRNQASADPVTVFAGQPSARLEAGAVCLVFADDAQSGLTLANRFAELQFASADLRVTHLLHAAQGTAHDVLRLDGLWEQRSLIDWPNLASVPFEAAKDTQDINFTAAPQVVHLARFVLCDHLVQGAGIGLAVAGRGIRALKRDAAAARWLVETANLLRVEGREVEVGSMTTLECWHPHVLADQLENAWKPLGTGGPKAAEVAGFTFVPGYMGRDSDSPTSDFIRPGVRRVDQGYAGLFTPAVVGALRQASEDFWVLLGGTTALCREAPVESEAGAHLLLHLPFVAVLGEAPALARALGRAGGGTLEMVRHDIQPVRIHVDAGLAIPPGALLRSVPPRPLPFARDLLAASTTSGAGLAANWFALHGPAGVSGWHVEQVQRTGPTPYKGNLAALPFPYPRAALMLGALLRDTTRKTWSVLSVLAKTPWVVRGIQDKPQAMDVSVRLLRCQPLLAGGHDAGVGTRSDLLVGSAGGLIAVPLSPADLAVDDRKHLIGLALASLAEPLFIVRREVGENVVGYHHLALPAADRDPLAFALRPLQAGAASGPDGRQTWPVPENLLAEHSTLRARPRMPRQYAAPLSMAALTGQLDTALLTGSAFELDRAGVGPQHSVWLQEWSDIRFAVTADPRAGAAPWMRDRIAARRLLPSTGAIAEALLRLDPSLPKERSLTLQTWLPAATASLDFAGRAGAFVGAGARILRGLGVASGAVIAAQGGPLSCRTLRRPRPVALPPNAGEPDTWRRSVAWYGMPGRSCIAFLGAWDMIPDALSLAAAQVPLRCLFVGNAQPHGLLAGSPGVPPAWRGAVVVQCVMFCQENRMRDPAHILLGMLQVAHARRNLRCSLRIGSRRLAFTRIELLRENGQVSPDRLVFVPEAGADTVTANGVFECAFVPTLADDSREPLTLARQDASSELDSAALRSLVLPVQGPQQDRYPLPLQRRTVFFADPAFDRSLSRIDPLSVNWPDTGEPVFKVWIDRPATTATESLVLRVKLQDPKAGVGRTWRLSVQLTLREGGPSEQLLFHPGGDAGAQSSVVLQADTFHTLPVSILRGTQGRLPAVGDTLVLEVASETQGPARVFVPVRATSSLPTPQAMYSLITTDEQRKQSWCSAHSPYPAPESLLTEVIDGQRELLVRRAVFKWVAFEPVSGPGGGLAWSVIRAERATQSLHVPQVLEYEERGG